MSVRWVTGNRWDTYIGLDLQRKYQQQQINISVMIIKIKMLPVLAPAIIAIGRETSVALVGDIREGVLVGLTSYIMNIVSSTTP